MTYNDRIDILIEKGFIETTSEADFPNEKNELIELDEFYQGYLESGYLNLENALFFFGKEDTLNAWAYKYNGLNVVCINSKAITYSRRIIDEHRNEIEQFLKENNLTYVFDNGLHATVLMKQFIEMFLFYHEVGHLIQEQSPWLASIYFQELPREGGFDINDHVSEFDADMYAAVKMASHLVRVCDRQLGLDSEEDKVRFIEDSSIIAISTYMMYRLLLFPNYPKFYIKEESHPHLVIRTPYLAIHLTKAIMDNFSPEVSKERILQNSTSFVEYLGDFLYEEDFSTLFFNAGKENFKAIVDYIYELNQLTVLNEGTAYNKVLSK